LLFLPEDAKWNVLTFPKSNMVDLEVKIELIIRISVGPLNPIDDIHFRMVTHMEISRDIIQ